MLATLVVNPNIILDFGCIIAPFVSSPQFSSIGQPEVTRVEASVLYVVMHRPTETVRQNAGYPRGGVLRLYI